MQFIKSKYTRFELLHAHEYRFFDSEILCPVKACAHEYINYQFCRFTKPPFLKKKLSFSLYTFYFECHALYHFLGLFEAVMCGKKGKIQNENICRQRDSNEQTTHHTEI